MAKLYTRRGDDGRTALFDGTPVGKDDQRVAVFGSIDELNAHLGVAISVIAPRAPEETWKLMHDRLVHIQHELFALGAELATPPASRDPQKTPPTTEKQVARLETWIDEAVSGLPPLEEFVLPGGDLAASQLHVCRTVCRRAERQVVALAAEAPDNPRILAYLNRLSDLLFAWARFANNAAGTVDQPWMGPRA
jgi:cob(I)alamin adenosyltransferase